MKLWSRRGAEAPEKRERAALFEFSRKLVGAAGIGEIAQALFRTIDDLFGVDQCILLSITEDQQRAVGVAAMGGMDLDVGSIDIDLSDELSAISLVVRDRAAHRVLDARRETLNSRHLADLLDARSALYVPLQTSGGVIAVAVVATTREMRAFRREEVDLIQSLANDAAVAIERARFAQALRDVSERELVVASLARAIRESFDPHDVLKIGARELGEQTDADIVRVAMLPSEHIGGLCAEWASASGELAVRPFERAEATGSAQLAIDDGQTVLARARSGDGAAGSGTHLAVPLKHREGVLGVLEIERAHSAFAVAEVGLVELIALEVAAALEHVRLYQEGRKHLDEQMALARAAQSLTADLRFERVLEHLVNEAVKVLRTTSASFYVYDREGQTLTLSAAFGIHERDMVGLRVGLVGLAGKVVQTGVSQYTNDYAGEFGSEVHQSFADVTRAIAAPVRWQGDLRGVISVAARDHDRSFSQHDIALLEAFADLASLALHNAEAYSAHSRQARIQAGFYRISQVLSSSLSRTETLFALAQAATDALDGSWSLVIGGFGEDEEPHLEGDANAPAAVREQLQGDQDYQGSPAVLATTHGRVITSRDITADDRLSDHWRELLADAGVASQLAVPISVHGRSSAVVLVCFEHPVRFGDEELVVANNLASAASAALERAGLFENERRVRRLAQILADVSALLAETLKTQRVLEQIVEQAAVLLEVDGCSLAVASADTGALRVHAAAGKDDRLVQTLRSSPVGGLVDEVAQSKRSVTVEELASETSSQLLDGERYESFLGVPLIHARGHLTGVLSAYSRRHRRFDEAEISALETFANSAAIAIRNAELYDGVKRERDTIEKLLASIGEGIVATDGAGRVTLWNKAAEEITGVPHNVAVGRAWRDVLGLSAETVVEDGQSVIEARPEGSPMWLSVTASRLRGREDEAGAIYAFRDVSAHHTLDQLKSDFVSTVSYVLRTPLAAIYGFTETLRRQDIELSDDDREIFLDYIHSETRRLTSIVDELLQVAYIDAGSVEIHPAPCDLGDVVEAAVNRVREKERSQQINVESLEGLTVRADRDKLQTVISNLVDNALRFTPEGGDVRIAAHRENGAVHLSVSDSGLGVPASEQKHLFTKFYVSPNASSDAGSGLGLFISKGLVTAMGGRIWVSSTLGSGSTFTIELPTAR